MKKNLIAGTDEVGRGCLAGPVVAAAVILKNKLDNLDDSKKLSTKKRNLLSKKVYCYAACQFHTLENYNSLHILY